MRFASLVTCLPGLLGLLGGLAYAAEGDGLVVTGNGVNVRERPQSGAPVLLQVQRSEAAVEMAREGDWVQVRLPDHNTVGWIHGSLLVAAGGAAAAPSAADSAGVASGALAPAPTAPASPPLQPPATVAGNAAAGAGAAPGGAAQLAAVGTPAADALARFRESVDYLNTRALAAAGVDLFTDVRLAGDDVAQVITTNAWGMVPEAGRRSYMNALLDRWQSTVGSPLGRLQIVDQNGQVLSESTRP
jgi:hypothetical protein